MGGKAWFAVFFLLAASAAHGAAANCKLQKVVDLPVTMQGLQPSVPVKINGEPLTLLADTGAFFSFVTPAAAATVKLQPGMLPYGYTVQGVTGGVTPELGVAREFTLGGATIHRVDFLILDDQMGLDGILGQNVFGYFETEFDLANGMIRLWRAEGCGDAMLAYWGKDLPISIMRFSATTPQKPDITAEAKVNGQSIRVTLDTGATRSGLKLSSARRLGLELDGPGVRSGGMMQGIGPRAVESWSVPVHSFEIGDEAIKNTRLLVAKTDLSDADMLLGADFFLSHRVMISHNQRKIYFTYNGGPVFRLGGDGASPQSPAAPGGPAETAPSAGAGLDADALSRRAAASVSRGDYQHALADLGRAVELEPKSARYLLERARVRLQAEQPLLARADLDDALKLDPAFTDALLLRGELRLQADDAPGGQADLQAAAARQAEDPSVALGVASIYVEVSRFDLALRHYDEWIATRPKDPRLASALNGRCWARALWGRELDKALADCDAALRRDPQRAAILDSRGLVHLRRGELDQAIADYDRALKLQPKLPWSLYGRGLARAGRGDAAGAAADLNAADAIAPGLRKMAEAYGVSQQALAALQAR